jgi:hypothetical protein
MALPLNIALLGIFVAILWRMYKDTPYALMPIASIVLVLTWQGVSVAYLETGVYSPELMLATHRTGATLRYVAAISSFVLAYWVVFRGMLSRRWLAGHQSDVRSLEKADRLAAPLILIGLGAMVALLAWAPRGDIASRSQFLVQNPVYLRDRLLDYQPYLALILGYATGVALKARTRILGYMTLLLMLTVLYLYGNKFSGITEAFVFFCVPFVALVKFRPMDRSVFGLSVKRQALIATMALTMLVVAGLVRQIQYFQIMGSEKTGAQYLAERVFVLQGGIWWNTDNSAIHGLYEPGFKQFIHFVQEEKYFPDSSLMYLMTRAIGYDLTYKIFTFDNSLFTGAFPAIFYEIGGRYGPIVFSGLTGAIIALSAGYVARKILLGQVLLALVAFGIYLPFSNLASAAEFTPLLSFGLLAKFAIIGFIELFNLVGTLAEAAKPSPAA